MTRRAFALLASLGLILAVFAVATSCGNTSDDPPQRSVTQLPDPGEVIDEPLMLAMSRAKNFHHIANVYLQDGNVDAAVAEVRKILTIEFPAGAPEAQDVLLDARARLGKLLLGQAKQEESLRVVDEGIASATRESYFLANLYTVRGEILETAAPNQATDEAKQQMRHDAIEAFEKSNEMQLVIQRALAKEMGL